MAKNLKVSKKKLGKMLDGLNEHRADIDAFESGRYEASIKVLGKVYTSSGKTAREAIEKLKVGSVAKGVSVLEIKKGKSSVSKILTAPQTFRLFSASPLMREIAIKQVSLMFQGI